MDLLSRGLLLASVLVVLFAGGVGGLLAGALARRRGRGRASRAGFLLGGACLFLFMPLAIWGAWRAMSRAHRVAGDAVAEAREESRRLAGTAKRGATRALRRAWWAGVDAAFQIATSVTIRDPREAFAALVADPVPPGISGLRGMAVTCGPFTQGYFVYEADAALLGELIPAIHARAVMDVPNDERLVPAEWDRERERLVFVRDRWLSEELRFFDVESAAGGRVFTCMRFPFEHTLVFKPGTRLVYHQVSEVKQ